MSLSWFWHVFILDCHHKSDISSSHTKRQRRLLTTRHILEEAAHFFFFLTASPEKLGSKAQTASDNAKLGLGAQFKTHLFTPTFWIRDAPQSATLLCFLWESCLINWSLAERLPPPQPTPPPTPHRWMSIDWAGGVRLPAKHVHEKRRETCYEFWSVSAAV